MLPDIHTRPSTWGIVIAMIGVAFVTLPTFHNFVIDFVILGVLIGTVMLAHHEGSKSKE